MRPAADPLATGGRTDLVGTERIAWADGQVNGSPQRPREPPGTRRDPARSSAGREVCLPSPRRRPTIFMTAARSRRGTSAMGARRTIHDLLARARARYPRVEPAAAHAAMQAGVLLIDIRTDRQRQRDGAIPGALVIDRTVLEWRIDPASGASHPAIPDLDTPLILICAQGYSSSLAVATLLDLGASNVSDVIGGFQAWRAAALPVHSQPPESGPAATGPR